MGRHRNARIITSPAAMRAAARRGEWHGSTGGQCPAYQQANLVILPQEAALEFAAFCTRNPKPCPLIEVTDISRWKRVIGHALRSQTNERQATEVAIAVDVLNRMLELGRPSYVRIA